MRVVLLLDVQGAITVEGYNARLWIGRTREVVVT